MLPVTASAPKNEQPKQVPPCPAIPEALKPLTFVPKVQSRAMRNPAAPICWPLVGLIIKPCMKIVCPASGVIVFHCQGVTCVSAAANEVLLRPNSERLPLPVMTGPADSVMAVGPCFTPTLRWPVQLSLPTRSVKLR